MNSTGGRQPYRDTPIQYRRTQKSILSVVNMILQSVLNIETHTERISGLVEDVESSVKEMKDTVNDIALKGVKLK